MQFNSIAFLFCFLPVTLLLFRLTPERVRSAFFVIASLIFYWLSAGITAMAALVIITLLAYLAQMALERRRSAGLLAGCLLLSAGVLAFCKIYQGGAYLAAGMSFYLFQLTAVLVDVFRGKIPAQSSLPAFFEQITFFPKLLSGPLVSPAELAIQQKNRDFSLKNVYEGARILILGLAMKVLLANRLGGLWSALGTIEYTFVSTPAIWLALIGYTMQLFLDFWGYSLMAIGLGRMFGYRLPENFLDPYTARSVSEFYRRWHATLGAWFREYLYFPLGGSRRGTARTLLNLAAVWLFTGFWHGVGWNYLIWALFLLTFIVMERLFLRKWLEKSRILSRVYVLLVILLSWVPFATAGLSGSAAEKVSQMGIFYGRMFGLAGKAANPLDYVERLRDYAPFLVCGGLLMTGLPRKLWRRFQNSFVTDVILAVLFWWSVYAIATMAQDGFVYFGF